MGRDHPRTVGSPANAEQGGSSGGNRIGNGIPMKLRRSHISKHSIPDSHHPLERHPTIPYGAGQRINRGNVKVVSRIKLSAVAFGKGKVKGGRAADSFLGNRSMREPAAPKDLRGRGAKALDPPSSRRIQDNLGKGGGIGTSRSEDPHLAAFNDRFGETSIESVHGAFLLQREVIANIPRGFAHRLLHTGIEPAGPGSSSCRRAENNKLLPVGR